MEFTAFAALRKGGEAYSVPCTLYTCMRTCNKRAGGCSHSYQRRQRQQPPPQHPRGADRGGGRSGSDGPRLCQVERCPDEGGIDGEGGDEVGGQAVGAHARRLPFMLRLLISGMRYMLKGR